MLAFHLPTTVDKEPFNTIPAAGVERARPCGHWILSSMNTFFKSYNLDLIGF